MQRTSAIGSEDEGSDLELVALTLDGDRRAFGALWDRQHRRVYGYCHRYLGAAEPAEDATGETFRRALEKLRTFGSERFGAWLYAIAHNVVHDELRRRGRVVQGDDAVSTSAIEPEDPPATTDIGELLACLTGGRRSAGTDRPRP